MNEEHKCGNYDDGFKCTLVHGHVGAHCACHSLGTCAICVLRSKLDEFERAFASAQEIAANHLALSVDQEKEIARLREMVNAQSDIAMKFSQQLSEAQEQYAREQVNLEVLRSVAKAFLDTQSKCKECGAIATTRESKLTMSEDDESEFYWCDLHAPPLRDEMFSSVHELYNATQLRALLVLMNTQKP